METVANDVVDTMQDASKEAIDFDDEIEVEM
jgi:hypothetical protein